MRPKQARFALTSRAVEGLSGMKIALFSIAALSFSGIAAAQQEEQPEVPEDARVSAEVDRQTWFLGENVLIHFKLETAGGEFKAEFGGDYRGAGFATRFKLKVTDENGELVPDLNHGNHMGGLGGHVEITPTKSFIRSIPLMYHAEITEPGEYEISIAHDFGWKFTPNRPRPTAKLKLTFVEPSADEAAGLARGWLEGEEYGGGTWGEKEALHPDFNLIRRPVYLETLREAAVRDGNENAVDGIASILTPEATRVLLEIAGDQKNPAWQKALDAAMRRMPSPNGPGNWFGGTILDEKRVKSWVPDLNPAARTAARQLLDSGSDYRAISTACSVLVGVGEPEDAAALSEAIDREFERIEDLPENETHSAVWHLQHAAENLLKRGARFSSEPKTPGEMIFYLTKMRVDRGKPESWPANWRGLLKQQLLVHANPHMRRAALEVLPRPVGQEFFQAIQVILKSDHVEPRRIACQFIAEDGIGFFKPEILTLIEAAEDEKVIEAATRAAAAIGARWEAAQLLVWRIAEPRLASPAIRSLTPLVFQTHFHGWTSHEFESGPYVARWRAVIEKHEAAIRAGEPLAVPHPDLTKELVPPQHSLSFPDGKSWPDWN